MSADADLELQTSPENFANLQVGDEGEFEIMVINNGPGDAGIGAPTATPIVVSTSIPLIDSSTVDFSINSNVSQECGFGTLIGDPRPGDPVVVIRFFTISELLAGSSITCYGNFVVTRPGNINEVVWGVNNGNPADTDPDNSNNQFVMTFRGFVPQVPTLANYSLLFMVLIFLAYTYFKINILPKKLVYQ